MTTTSSDNFVGARTSNASNVFHEIWSLKKALALLDQKSGLVQLVVEGVGTPSKITDNKK